MPDRGGIAPAIRMPGQWEVPGAATPAIVLAVPRPLLYKPPRRTDTPGGKRHSKLKELSDGPVL
jgi:hypothetical protein